nr:SPFH domain-containing protein [Nonomuraea polychroma]
MADLAARLVVRESQVAVFVNEGEIIDAFAPGTYTLETRNLPILSTLKGWKYGFHSPFKAEVPTDHQNCKFRATGRTARSRSPWRCSPRWRSSGLSSGFTR